MLLLDTYQPGCNCKVLFVFSFQFRILMFSANISFEARLVSWSASILLNNSHFIFLSPKKFPNIIKIHFNLYSNFLVLMCLMRPDRHYCLLHEWFLVRQSDEGGRREIKIYGNVEIPRLFLL